MQTNVTYRELLEALQKLSEEELAMHVTVHHVHPDNYYPVERIDRAEAGTLDKDHPVLVVDV